MTEGHSHTGAHDMDLDAAPPAAKRLWSELFCMCGECERTTLADCTCDFAAKERKLIAERLAKSGLGNAEREEAIYAALREEYVKRHGSEAEVASIRLHAWLDPLLTLIGVLAGLVVLIALAERLRSRLARRRDLGVAGRQPTSARSSTKRPKRP